MVSASAKVHASLQTCALSPTHFIVGNDVVSQWVNLWNEP